MATIFLHTSARRVLLHVFLRFMKDTWLSLSDGNAFPKDLGHSPQGVLRLNGRGASSGRRENCTAPSYSCSTAAAKKNSIFRRANPKSAKTLRIGFCQAF